MKKVIFISFILISISIGTFVSAQGYIPIVGLPGVDSNALSTEGYVNALYKLAITVACLLALFKIIFGGVKWALSDVVTDKGDAKKDIKGALLGLLIVLSAVLVLNTINPNLTQLNIFGEGAPSIDAIERGKIRPPRTVLDQCPTGSTFTITVANPNGSCVSVATQLVEDYRDSPEEGEVRCGPNLRYNPVTNSCDVVTTIYPVPPEILQSIDDNSGGDPFWYKQGGDDWCRRSYPDTAFDPANNTCVPDNAI